MAKKKLTPERVRRLLADPGERAKLPDKYLTPALLAKRDLNTRLNSPVAEGSSVTGRDAAHQRDAAVSLKFAPADTALKQQYDINSQQQRNVNDWYSQYQQQLKDIADADAKRHLDTAATVGNTATSAANTIRSVAAPGVEGEQAARNMATLGNAYQASVVTRNNAADDYASARVGNAGLSKLEGLAKVLQARGNLDASARDLASQKGSYKVQAGQDIVDRERKYGLEKAAFGVNVATAKANIEDKAAQRAADATPTPGEQDTAARLAFFRKHGYYPPTGPPKAPKGKAPAKPGKPRSGPGSLTTGQEQNVVDQLDSLVALIKDPKTPTDSHKVRQALISGHNPNKKAYSKTLVNAAFDLAKLGYLSPANVKALHRAGIHIKGRYETAPAKGAPNAYTKAGEVVKGLVS